MSVARSSGEVAAASSCRSARPCSSRSVAGCTPVGQVALRRVEDEDLLEQRELVAHLQDPLEEARVLDDRQLGLGVAGQVLDLLGRRRVVDADRRGPQELRRGVEPVEVGPVAHHQQDALARPAPPAPAGPRRPGRRGRRTPRPSTRPTPPGSRPAWPGASRGPDGPRRSPGTAIGAVWPATAAWISSAGTQTGLVVVIVATPSALGPTILARWVRLARGDPGRQT